MKKKITSFLLAILVFTGAFVANAPVVSASAGAWRIDNVGNVGFGVSTKPNYIYSWQFILPPHYQYTNRLNSSTNGDTQSFYIGSHYSAELYYYDANNRQTWHGWTGCTTGGRYWVLPQFGTYLWSVTVNAIQC